MRVEGPLTLVQANAVQRALNVMRAPARAGVASEAVHAAAAYSALRVLRGVCVEPEQADEPGTVAAELGPVPAWQTDSGTWPLVSLAPLMGLLEVEA